MYSILQCQYKLNTMYMYTVVRCRIAFLYVYMCMYTSTCNCTVQHTSDTLYMYICMYMYTYLEGRSTCASFVCKCSMGGRFAESAPGEG